MKNSPGYKKKLPRSVTDKKMLIDHDLSITRQTELLGIARSTVYRVPTPVSAKTLTLQHAIDTLYTKYPFYGQRRLKVVLERDYNILAGRDIIRSTMRTLGIQAIYPKPNTSKPHPDHKVYPYLLRNVPIIASNQVWSTDITYIRLEGGFCYLVALIDWYSRKVLSWRLSNSMETSFCTEALEEALTIAVPDLHNSDQGVQFTSSSYIAPLKKHNIKISMDGRGRCLDNIFVERLWRSVKYEDIFIKGYTSIDEVRDGLTKYFKFYNEERPHQSLNYEVPNEVYKNS